MLKKVNKLRRSLSKNSVDKQESKEKESNKKKKSNQKVNQSSQTDDSTSSGKQNVNKKLNFKKMTTNKDKSKMSENNKSTNSLRVEDVPFMGDAESDDDLEEKVVEEEPFPKTVRILESENGSKVYLIGTAHFSEESCKDVEYVIKRVKPDVVVLELCKERFGTLMLDEEVLMKQIMNFNLSEAHEIIKSYGVLQGVIHLLFLYISKEITKQTGMLPGSEIRKALKESQKIPHCICNLGDRPFHVTFKRAIGSLTIFQKFSLALSILFSNPKMDKEDVEKYKQNDILEGCLQELGENYPMMKKALVDERDMYLAYSMQMACRSNFRNKNEFYTERLKTSRNSLATVEQQLTSCKHELENFRKIKSANSYSLPDQSESHDSQIETYEMKLERLEHQYNLMHEQVASDTENLSSFSKPLNSEHDPKVVVAIVGMGHLNGIQRYFNKVTESEIIEIIGIPKPSLRSKLMGKAVRYTFYGLVVYTFCRYVIPTSVKSSLVDLSFKSVIYSKEFINEKLSVKNVLN